MGEVEGLRQVVEAQMVVVLEGGHLAYQGVEEVWAEAL